MSYQDPLVNAVSKFYKFLAAFYDLPPNMFYKLNKYTMHPKKAETLLSVSSEYQNSETRMFDTWHISTPTGSAPKDLKKILKTIWNDQECEQIFLKNLKEFIDKGLRDNFKLEFLLWGDCDQWPHDDFWGFQSLNSQEKILLRASKKKVFSLRNIAAAAVSLELEHINDIHSLIVNGCIPASLENILVKYI